jgi:penicillin-binding protein 1A
MRKFNEILLAIEIERRLSKEEIFELYVNRVFLGHRAYGFEAARRCTTAEHRRADPGAARHAGRHSQGTLAQQSAQRSGGGQGAPQLDSRAHARPRLHRHASLRGAPGAGHRLPARGPDHPRGRLRRGNGAPPDAVERYGMSAYTAGLRVYTTLDSRLQRVARRPVSTA